MRQLFLDKGLLAVREACEPVLDDYSVLVDVHYSFVSSGTERATVGTASANPLTSNVVSKVRKVLQSLATEGYAGTKALVEARLSGTVQSIGYSCSGRVIAVGKKVNKLKIGDPVACAGAGLANHADIVCVPENLVVPLPSEKFLKSASATTIGSIALQGLRRADVRLGEYVAVVGLGLLGQLTVQMAKASGCKVIGLDLVKSRLDLATKYGADLVLDASSETVKKEIDVFTGREGADHTIITAASKSDAIVQQAMEITRKKGKVVLVGDVGLKLERSPFYKKEIDFLISCSYGPGRYDTYYERYGHDYPYAYVRWTENRNMQTFVEMVASGQIDVGSIVTDELKLADASKIKDLLSNSESLGVVLDYGKTAVSVAKVGGIAKEAEKPVGLKFKPAKADQLRLGLVGVGGFAKIKLLPIVSKMGWIKVTGVTDADVANATNVSRQYGAKAYSSTEELVTKGDVDALLIASPHKFHSAQAIAALRSGKAVFMEKPMVTDSTQLDEIVGTLRDNPELPFCVDFNRTYSPFIQKVKREVAGRTSPLVVHYRMNAGFIPKEHWVQTEAGAGRIIGEGCHIFDLFCFLTGSKPTAVSVDTIRPGNYDLLSTDNMVSTVSFEDGSVCSLLYTAIGHGGLGKERMEVFYDSKSIVMNDYKTLEGFGLPSTFNEKKLSIEKGHEQLLETFFGAVKDKGNTRPIDVDRLETVSSLSLIVDELALRGGGEREL